MSDYGAAFEAADPTTRNAEMSPAERTADPTVIDAPTDVETGGAATAAEGERPRRGFPSPLTIITIVLVLVWLVALFIPSGEYELDESGRPIPGSYEEVDRPLDFGESVEDLWLSPINGLYGIQDLETGHVAPFNAGVMFGSAHVFLFILAIGGFMTVVFRTGSLDLGIAHLAHRFRARGAMLIVVLSLLFGVLGSVMSWSDESLGFYALLIPLMLSLGYDRVSTVAVVTVAPFVGSIGSTVNPFRIGVGADAAGIDLADGLGLRLVLFVLTMAATIAYTLRYATRVKADPTLSLVPHDPEDFELVQQAEREDLAPLSGKDKAVIGLVAFTFLLLMFSIVPWGSILHNTLVDPETHETTTEAFSWELGWWLPELSAVFVVMSIVVGIVGRLGENELASSFLRGVVDFAGPAFLVAFARAVAVVLTNTKTIDTVLNSMEGIVDGLDGVWFILLFAVISLPLAFFIGSGSAGMALVMPILAPLADFADVDRSLILTTYNAMGALLLLVVPTNILLMAGLGLARVSFDKYLRFVMPLVGILTAIILAVALIGVALS